MMQWPPTMTWKFFFLGCCRCNSIFVVVYRALFSQRSHPVGCNAVQLSVRQPVRTWRCQMSRRSAPLFQTWALCSTCTARQVMLLSSRLVSRPRDAKQKVEKKEIGHSDAKIELILGATRRGATCLARAQSDVCTGARGFTETQTATVWIKVWGHEYPVNHHFVIHWNWFSIFFPGLAWNKRLRLTESNSPKSHMYKNILGKKTSVFDKSH